MKKTEKQNLYILSENIDMIDKIDYNETRAMEIGKQSLSNGLSTKLIIESRSLKELK